MSKAILNVPDISCGHCEQTILNALRDRPGVKAVRVSIPDRTVNLEYDEGELNLEQVSEILDEEGYPVASARAA